MTKPAQITVGCDPDCDKHGIAIYYAGQLYALHNWQLIDILRWVQQQQHTDILFSIEDVASQNFVYGRNNSGDRKVMYEKGRGLGKVQQAQIELQRVLKSLGIEYALHKPQRGNWAKNEPQFKQVTGWEGRSNADQRSAAFFGWLEASKR